MFITDIKRTKKGRYALFCGADFLFSVDEDAYASFDIHPGMEIGEEELSELRKKSEYNKALNRAFLILGSRDHSEYELFTKLGRSFDDETAEAVVSRVRELGYLDDEAFAQRFSEELLRKGRSSAEIRSRLAAKRVSTDIVDAVVNSLDTDDRDSLRLLITKKYLRRLKEEDGRRKVYASLLRKGYRSSDIIAVLNETDFAEEYDGQ